MKVHCRSMSTAVLAAALVFAVSGCKSNKAANSANSSQPAAAAAGQPASSNQASMPPGSGSAYAPAQAPAPQPPPPPAAVNLPAGTTMRVRLDQDLGSKINQPGDVFRATVVSDVVHNGQLVIPAGARAAGMVIDAQPLGRFKGQALLAIRLDRVETQWGAYPVHTSTIDRVERGKGRRTALFAGGGGALGALIGGLAGGGKGALIGGLAGAGAGTAGDAFTGNRQIVLPAETILTFRLRQSVHIVEGP